MKKDRCFIAIIIFFFSGYFSLHATPTHKTLIVSFFKNHDPLDRFLRHITQQTSFDQCTLILIGQELIKQEIQEIISHYQRQFSNINFYTHTQGPAKALNTIIKTSNTEFICLLSASCYLYPNAVQKGLRFLEKNNLAVGYSDFYVTYNAEVNLDCYDYWYLAKYPTHCTIDLAIGGPFLIWKTILHDAHGYFDENYTFLYTEEFFKRAIANKTDCAKIPGICGALYFDYRNQPSLLCSSQDITRYYQEKKAIGCPKNHQPSSKTQKPFVIIIPSYNNEDWYQYNLDSALWQCYDNYRIIYINDASTDKTGLLVGNYLTCHDTAQRVTFIDNAHRLGALENIYNAVHSCNKEEIIILLDGDDHLTDPCVLERLNTVYQTPEIWMTYGQFVWFPQMIPGSAQAIPDSIITSGSFREHAWASTHLRTFYAGLFHKIDIEDLLLDGKFFPMAWDLAIMFPMLEMAGNHSRFIPELIYMYNTANPISDHTIDIELQQNLANIIRNKSKYEIIVEL